MRLTIAPISPLVYRDNCASAENQLSGRLSFAAYSRNQHLVDADLELITLIGVTQGGRRA